jgi:hypothetical protein
VPTLAYDSERPEISIPKGFSSGGNGGNGSEMDARITKLEGQFDKLNEKVDELRIDVAVLKEKVTHLPSKDFIVKVVLTALALITAVSLFQGKIQAALGLLPPV